MGEGDDELGKTLLAFAIHQQASELGLSESDISEEFAEAVIRNLPNAETETAANTALEKALHKAAAGEFSVAGRLIREHLESGALSLVEGKLALSGARRAFATQEFVKNGAENSQRQGQESEALVLRVTKSLLRTWKSPRKPTVREIAKSIAKETKLSDRTVRRYLTRAKLDAIWSERNLG